MAVNTVIFDFDGTLANTNEIIINSWQRVYRTVRGEEESRDVIVKTFGEPLDVSMRKVFPEEDIEEMIRIYRSYQIDNFEDMIEAFPGMIDLVKKLKLSGYNVAVVTSRMRNTTMKGLNKFGLTDFVDFVVTSEDTTKHKPDPEPVNIVLSHYGVEAECAIMVGDSMFDIKCAHNAGIKAVMVDWAIAVSKEDLNGPDAPDYIIGSASDLFKYL